MDLTLEEKRIIFYILVQIMEADAIEAPAEIAFLNSIFQEFPDFVIAYPKNLRRRVLRFFGALPLASFACKCLCLGGA